MQPSMHPLIFKIIGMFAALDPEDLDRLQPATRRRFAQICRHWAELAEQPDVVNPPRSGVLYHLRNGERAP